LVVTYVEEFIKTNQTEQEIIDNLDALCTQLPIFQDQCVAIVGQYVPSLIEWILNQQNPQQFCSSVGLCSARATLNPLKSNKVEEHRQHGWKGKSHKSHHKSHKSLHKSHKSHHKSHHGMAHTAENVMVKTNTNMKSGMMMKKQKGFVRHPSFRYTNSNSTCSLCQELVAFVQELIARDNTIKQIIEEIRAVCYQIPPPDQGMCLDAINQEIDALMAWIQDGKNPLEFCTYITVC